MSIIDYTKKLTMFDNYDIQMLQMMIDYLKLKDKKEFNFLNEISLKDVQLYWYTDSNKNNLGGFHLLSLNVIYINEISTSNNSRCMYINKTNKIVQAFPVIIHELYHYWQFKKNPVLYFFLQFPFVRDYTIEKSAYKIQDYIIDNNVFMNMSSKQIVHLKKRYNFSSFQFDEFQKKYLS